MSQAKSNISSFGTIRKFLKVGDLIRDRDERR